LVDGRNPEEKDIEGYRLPTLVYLAREKRPQHFHNYKAGAMNALVNRFFLKLISLFLLSYPYKFLANNLHNDAIS